MVAPVVVPSAASAQQAAAAAQPSPDKFFINAFDVSGATVLDQAAIENAVYDHAGPDRTSADVEAARKALEDAYKARGYEAVLVEIPPQPEALFAQGIVQLKVTEAPVGKVEVTGATHHSEEVVRRQFASVVPGKPLNTKALVADAGNAGRFPDRQVTPLPKAGATPGTVDVELKVDDSLPLHGSVELTDDHSPNTRPLRLNANITYSNLWQLGHSLSATYVVAPQDREGVEVFVGSYSIPILDMPLRLVFSGLVSNTNVAALGGVNVLGDGFQVGARAIYTLQRKNLTHNFSVGFDFKDYRQNTTLNSTLTGKAPIRYIPLTASYGLATGTDTTNFDMNLSLTAGLRAIKRIECFDVAATVCNPTDQFRQRGFESNENFVHANLDLLYKRALGKDFNATLHLYGQVADSHLIDNEQFGIGGGASVRGYLQSEAIGDDGYAASLQIDLPSIASKLPSFVDEMRFFGFVEHGQTHLLRTQDETRRTSSLLSVGGGARMKLFKHISGELNVGLPLTNGSSTRANDVRTTFSAKGEF